MALTTQLWTLNALSVELGISSRVLGRRLSDVAPDEVEQQDGRQVKRWRLARVLKHLRAVDRTTAGSNGATADPERARLARARARRAELEVAALERSLLPEDEVVHAWQMLVAAFRARCLALPSKLAPRLAMSESRQSRPSSPRPCARRSWSFPDSTCRAIVQPARVASPRPALTASPARGELRSIRARHHAKHGISEQLIAVAKRAGLELSEREIRYRIQCAKAYPTEGQIGKALADFATTEAQIARAVGDFSTWRDLSDANFPPYPADPQDPPADHRDARPLDSRGRRAIVRPGALNLPQSGYRTRQTRGFFVPEPRVSTDPRWVCG